MFPEKLLESGKKILNLGFPSDLTLPCHQGQDVWLFISLTQQSFSHKIIKKWLPVEPV
jgi:hypothetical protein